ncbi:MAG: helix-turn-helix transcriptional regulator [Chloroflexaceae bacterium]|nr:helix-turn-helix transcriptional regulator [Chloroflexaceae bacterium]
MRSNLYLLMGRKAQQENRRISLRTVAEETGLNYYTVRAIATEKIRLYPKDALASLCTYFKCNVGDLFALADGPDPQTEGEV